MAFPTYSDSVDVAQLQAAVEEAIAARLQVGNTTISGSSVPPGGLVSVNITFPRAFPVPPRVVGAIAGFVANSSVIVFKTADQITTTGARLQLVNTGTTAATFSNLPVQYIAAAT